MIFLAFLFTMLKIFIGFFETFFSQIFKMSERGETDLQNESPRQYRDRSRSPVKSTPSDVANSGTNLFVTGLQPKVREADIEEVFSRYGVVKSKLDLG
jgi:RNA recognition motif-containing protein